MKKIIIILVLLNLLLCTHAQLSLLYPRGGESFPVNGKHTLVWTNESNLHVTLFIDWYDTNGNLVFEDGALYGRTLPGGTNNFVLSNPYQYPLDYFYKIRLVGTNLVVNITNTSDYITITDAATLCLYINDNHPWLPGQNRTNTLSWTGFERNDLIKITLESPSIHQENYGFLVTNITITEPKGTQSLIMEFPSFPEDIHPSTSHNLFGGSYSFILLNERCQIIEQSEEVDIINSELHMSLTKDTNSFIVRGETNTCGSVVLTTYLATGNITITNIELILTSFSTNWLSLKFSLIDESKIISSQTLQYKPNLNNDYFRKVNFPLELIMMNNQEKRLTLQCEVLNESETEDFIWTTQSVSPFIQGGIGSIYLSGNPLTTAIIPSTGDFISIIQTSQPRFFLKASHNEMAIFEIIGRPGSIYSIEYSTNLLDWSEGWNHVTISNNVQFLISTTNKNQFFRLREN